MAQKRKTISHYERLLKTKRIKRVTKYVKQAWFKKAYVGFALTFLMITTVLWSLLGSNIQQSNADQIVNAYLFENKQTFDGSQLPAQHSFLFKWPLFLLIKAGSYSAFSFQVVTVATVLFTVALLAYLLYRIEKRPIVFGTIILGLSSVLLLVPVQPYSAALLPVNMSMITTRNVEYIVYIAAVILLFRPGRLRKYGAILSIALLAVLMVSDYLFLSMSLLAGILLLWLSLLKKQPVLKVQALRWIFTSICAVVIAFGLTSLLKSLGLIAIVGLEGAAPYSVAASIKDVMLGILYGVASLFTNMGANPAYDAVALAQIPEKFVSRSVSFGAVGYVVNAIVFGGGLYAAYQIIKKPKRSAKISHTHLISQLLICSLIAVLILFVISDHYYAVDARYTGILPFVLFIAIAGYSRTKLWQPTTLVVAGLIIFVGSLLSSVAVVSNFNDSKLALQPYAQRTQRITEVLSRYETRVLVGDYWRVVPVKSATSQRTPILPLQDCTTVRTVLTSKHWQSDLSKPFVYLLSFDKGLTDYPKCSLTDIVNTFGRPNSSILISGTLENPSEMLLFYDNGRRPVAPHDQMRSVPATILPIEFNELTDNTCASYTVAQIVAHQDDDLLFMNPDLQTSLRAGQCVRTIYLTAGDSGSQQSYWLSREQGSQAAYASMLGIANDWTKRIVKIDKNQYAVIASPRLRPSVSLIYLRLPDGNINGSGFSNNRNESLQKMLTQQIRSVLSVDRQSRYEAKSVTKTLAKLLRHYKPSEIRSQSEFTGTQYADHSDHAAAGQFAKRAIEQYANDDNSVKRNYYIGYPINEFSPNVGGQSLIDKEAAFAVYANYDGSVCRSVAICGESSAYAAYLTRQYTAER